jgi:hypothetical protein
MTIKKKKRRITRLEEVQDDLEKKYPRYELCSYDYLAYLLNPELNELAKPSVVPRKIVDRQKKLLSEITLTLPKLQGKYPAEILTSKEFSEFQEVLMDLYLYPSGIDKEYAMALYSNSLLFGIAGLKQIMPKSFHDVLDFYIVPLTKLVYSLSEHDKELGKKGTMIKIDKINKLGMK